jgi:hypothetical protein
MSAAVRGFSHWMLMIIFLVLVSSQTSFLSSPTDKARMSLKGLKVMPVTRAQRGGQVEDGDDSFPQLVLRKEGYRVMRMVMTPDVKTTYVP